MHLVLPFAGPGAGADPRALAGLDLPHLERLLALLPAAPPREGDSGDELDLSPPHERVLARARGWPLADGLLPLAAAAAVADGVALPDEPARGIAWLHPVHWHMGTEQVSLTDPAALDLAEDEARALFDALRPLAEDEGYTLHWARPTRWYLTHERLARLPCASLDRVVGRNVDPWLNSHPDALRVRRLQAEAQMLWHAHPVNAAREARGLQPVNSFWLSGGGPRPASGAASAVAAAGAVRTAPAAATMPELVEHLRAPALAGDLAAWLQAWQRVDALTLAPLLEAARAGQAVTLTLCGERHARSWQRAAGSLSLWQRLRPGARQPARPVLEAL